MVARGPILEFRGEHRRASSFYDQPEAGFRLERPMVYGSPLGAWLSLAEHPWCRSREYGFQALKCVKREDAEWVLESKDSAQAKRRGSAKGEDGRVVEMVPGWEHGLAQAAMLHCARLQFMPDGGMRDYLRSTGYRPMVEETTRWHDTKWGAVWAWPGAEDGLRKWASKTDDEGRALELRGENWLGRVLMRVRAEIDCEVLL